MCHLSNYVLVEALYKHTNRQMTHAAIRMHYLQIIAHLIVMKTPTGLRSSYDCICGSNLHKLAWPR